MPLQNFSVVAQRQLDDSVPVKADDGKERVVGYVKRRALDDYFSQRELTLKQRLSLVESNLDPIAATISRKYECGEWRPEDRYGSTVRRVEIEYDDLRSGPPLSDVRLIMEENAGFQRPFA